MTEDHPYYIGRERKYDDLTKEQIPLTESLLDCMERTIPLWENKIVYELMEGRNVLVVAHANTLRGLVKTIGNLETQKSKTLWYQQASPSYTSSTWMQMGNSNRLEENSISQIHMNGRFLEKQKSGKNLYKGTKVP
jgi:broad specificity phosphatase PhoE